MEQAGRCDLLHTTKGVKESASVAGTGSCDFPVRQDFENLMIPIQFNTIMIG